MYLVYLCTGSVFLPLCPRRQNKLTHKVINSQLGIQITILNFTSVRMFMCPSHFTITYQRVKNVHLVHTQTPGVHQARQSRATYITLLGVAKLNCVYLNSFQYFITFPQSVPSNCVRQRTQDEPQSRYFLVTYTLQSTKKNID